MKIPDTFPTHTHTHSHKLSLTLTLLCLVAAQSIEKVNQECLLWLNRTMSPPRTLDLSMAPANVMHCCCFCLFFIFLFFQGVYVRRYKRQLASREWDKCKQNKETEQRKETYLSQEWVCEPSSQSVSQSVVCPERRICLNHWSSKIHLGALSVESTWFSLALTEWEWWKWQQPFYNDKLLSSMAFIHLFTQDTQQAEDILHYPMMLMLLLFWLLLLTIVWE